MLAKSKSDDVKTASNVLQESEKETQRGGKLQRNHRSSSGCRAEFAFRSKLTMNAMSAPIGPKKKTLVIDASSFPSYSFDGNHRTKK